MDSLFSEEKVETTSSAEQNINAVLAAFKVNDGRLQDKKNERVEKEKSRSQTSPKHDCSEAQEPAQRETRMPGERHLSKNTNPLI